jgi:hypothetical protein
MIGDHISVSKPTLCTKPTMEEIKKQFAVWRSKRRCRGPVPQELWEAAMGLAKDYPPARIARVLGLDYGGLKRRIQARGEQGCMREESHHFIELSLEEPEPDCGCMMEIEDQKGGKVKVHMRGGFCFELLELAQAFWRRNI